MTTTLNHAKATMQKEDKRGIRLGLIWLGERLEPVAGDSESLFYRCNWKRGQYERHSVKEIEAYKNKFSGSPHLGFHLEINNERWEVESYHIVIGFVEGHNHDLRDLGSRCNWQSRYSITTATHAVDLDTPWHLRETFTVPTDAFLPPKHNNLGGKLTVAFAIYRSGWEKDNLKARGEKLSSPRLFTKSDGRRQKALKYRSDTAANPLATFVFRISFHEITEPPPTSTPQDAGTPTGIIYQSNPEYQGPSSPRSLSNIDEDIKLMTSFEKDMEIMRLRGIVESMSSKQSLESLGSLLSPLRESQKTFLPRDMSKLAL